METLTPEIQGFLDRAGIPPPGSPKQSSDSEGIDYQALAKSQLGALERVLEKVFPDYRLNTHTRPVFEALSLYFHQNPLFEEVEFIKNPSLKKGLLFMGNPGTGKSLTLRIFSKITNDLKLFHPVRFKVQSCKRIVREYKELCKVKDGPGGGYVLNKYGAKSYTPGKEVGGRKPIAWAFDDIGAESVALVWGNRVNVMEEILIDRYEEIHESGMVTHGTTNLTLEGIEKYYSLRVADRFKQMFNAITFRGDSMRK